MEEYQELYLTYLKTKTKPFDTIQTLCQFFVVQGQKILDKVATRLLGDNDNSNPQIPKTYKPNTTCCVADGPAGRRARVRVSRPVGALQISRRKRVNNVNQVMTPLVRQCRLRSHPSFAQQCFHFFFCSCCLHYFDVLFCQDW